MASTDAAVAVPEPAAARTCPVCGAPPASPRATYCGQICRKRAEVATRPVCPRRACLQCGAEVPRGRRLFCSERCGRHAMLRRYAPDRWAELAREFPGLGRNT